MVEVEEVSKSLCGGVLSELIEMVRVWTGGSQLEMIFGVGRARWDCLVVKGKGFSRNLTGREIYVLEVDKSRQI